jgi:O-antigen ligase
VLTSIYLSITLFLLSADLLFFDVGGNRIKYGYLIILGMWLFQTPKMIAAGTAAVQRMPRYVLLPLIPLALAVGMSADLFKSILWTLWLGFDLFTVLTIYSFLKAHAFSETQLRNAVLGSLTLIAGFALFQYVSIYGFNYVVFTPQHHFEFYRLNGIAGWPHFLNIFSFLLLPLVLLQDRLTIAAKLVLVVLIFVLVQSTAKTGWALVLMLGLLLVVLAPFTFVRNYVFFLLPIMAVALLVPTPVLESQGQQTVVSTEKIAKFADDLNLADQTTSGTDRMLVNEMGLRVWRTHPWFGVGPKAYKTYVWTQFDEVRDGEKFRGDRVANAKNENIWIEMLSENGLLFTLGFVLVLVRVLWVRRFAFANPMHLGAWIALVLYFVISGQVSQNDLLTLTYAVVGIYLYARELPDTRAVAATRDDRRRRPVVTA